MQRFQIYSTLTPCELAELSNFYPKCRDGIDKGEKKLYSGEIWQILPQPGGCSMSKSMVKNYVDIICLSYTLMEMALYLCGLFPKNLYSQFYHNKI